MSRREHAIEGIAHVLAHAYVDVRAPREQAEVLVDALTTADSGAWREVQSAICRRELAVPLSKTALEVVTLRVLVVFVHATWSQSPSNLEVIAALRQLGVPESWVFVAGELGPSHLQTGAA